jgi:hypothetical protein
MTGEFVILAPVHPSGGTGGGGEPAEQKEVVAAQRAPVRQKDKMHKAFHGVSNADASEVNGPAMRTARGKHTHFSSIH